MKLLEYTYIIRWLVCFFNKKIQRCFWSRTLAVHFANALFRTLFHWTPVFSVFQNYCKMHFFLVSSSYAFLSVFAYLHKYSEKRIIGPPRTSVLSIGPSVRISFCMSILLSHRSSPDQIWRDDPQWGTRNSDLIRKYPFPICLQVLPVLSLQTHGFDSCLTFFLPTFLSTNSVFFWRCALPAETGGNTLKNRQDKKRRIWISLPKSRWNR